MNLQRLLVERIDQRILVGILAFLGIIVLVGWIAINEGGRMQAFERQYSARSIERGAALFNTNCSPCHGVNGLGANAARVQRIGDGSRRLHMAGPDMGSQDQNARRRVTNRHVGGDCTDIPV